MSSEMDTNDPQSTREEGEIGTMVVDGAQVLAMRRLMHELSNVLTGVMISGGLLEQYLHPGKSPIDPPGAARDGASNFSGDRSAGVKALWHYAAGVCEGCERGCALLRELRRQLLTACGEAEAGAIESSAGGRKPDAQSF